MKSFKIFFQMRLSNFYSIGMIIGIFTILFSSCSSVKEGSYAYMDDIYVNQYPDEVIVLVDEVEVDENGEPPSNVPGAAYVYQDLVLKVARHIKDNGLNTFQEFTADELSMGTSSFEWIVGEKDGFNNANNMLVDSGAPSISVPMLAVPEFEVV